MDEEFDDLRSLSERVPPSSSSSFTHNSSHVSARNSNRTRSIKPHKSISLDNQVSNRTGETTTAIANTGDVIQMSDGSRKKYNGSSWRRMCSKPNCSYYMQSRGLCKPHLAALKRRKGSGTKTSTSNKDNGQISSEKNGETTGNNLSTTTHSSAESEGPKRGDVIQLPNGIRKKYDGRQYRRVCANPDCVTVVHGSLQYQNGLCPYHYHEFKAKSTAQPVVPENNMDNTTVKIESANPTVTPSRPTASSPSRKRRRPPSSSSVKQEQSSPSLPDTSNTVPTANSLPSITTVSSAVNLEHPNKGDVIQMENGSRKKFDGIVWRRICSVPTCLIAAQRNELCRKHFVQFNGKPQKSPDMPYPGSARTLSSQSTSSIDDKQASRSPKKKSVVKVKDEPIDMMEHGEEQEEEDEEAPDMDNTSNSFNVSDYDMRDDRQQNGHSQEDSLAIDDENEDNLGTRIDHTLINALSASRQKFPTNHLKKWLRDHRSHPYPSNQEKIQLAKQSAITYDQVTTWFNNARAILRRRHAKLRHSFDDEEPSRNENKKRSHRDESESNHKSISKATRSLPLFNGVCCRSVGVQCNPSTANQTTSTSIRIGTSDDELLSDRTVRILMPSSRNTTRRHPSSELITNGLNTEDISNEEIVLTSTCLDDDQMARLKEFCSKFKLKLSNIVDEYTTHLITDEEGETLVCPLSKKVIQAVARHMYIVTYRWIDICLKEDKLLNEKPFEIQGDLTLTSDHNGMQRSRQSILPHSLPKTLLLEDFAIMLKCDGCQEMMNNDELIELVKLSGAKHTTDSHFSRIQSGITRVVLCEKEYLINRREMYEKCTNAGVHFLTPEWFLESLVQYRVQPFQEYQIAP